MQRRERAGGIGRLGLPGKGESLAAAAAEIQLPPGAAAAGLGHPLGAAERLESGAAMPDLGQRLVLDVVEGEGGDGFGRMAGQDLAGWRHVQVLLAPAAHAGLGVAGVVVRHDIVDHQHALQPLLCCLDQIDRRLGLRAGRHQRRPVLERPAIILDMGDLEALGAKLDRELDDLVQMVEVLAVHHGVDGQRQADRGDLLGERQLLGMAVLVAADPVGALGPAVLDAELEMIEPGIGQALELGPVEQDAGGDQVGVLADRRGMADQLRQIRPQGRLAAGKMGLEHAQGMGLIDHMLPGGRIELTIDPLQLQRIGAVGALQRTAVGQLGEQRHGRRDPPCGRRIHGQAAPLGSSCRRRRRRTEPVAPAASSGEAGQARKEHSGRPPAPSCHAAVRSSTD